MTTPEVVDQYNLPRFSTSEANNDHHAFGWFANHELLSVPTARYFSERYDADEDGYKESYRQVREDELNILHVDVDESGNEAITARGQVSHDGKVQRSVSINDFIYSVGVDGVRVVNVQDANTVVDEALFDWEISDWENTVDEYPQYTIDHTEIGTSARDVLEQRGIERGDLMLVTQERNQGEIEVVLRAGSDHFRLRGSSASDLALVDEAFQFTKSFQHNTKQPFDVNDDGLVTPIDALLVINELARQELGDATSSEPIASLNAGFQPADSGDDDDDDSDEPVDMALLF